VHLVVSQEALDKLEERLTPQLRGAGQGAAR
jgi:hypothetical protein